MRPGDLFKFFLPFGDLAVLEDDMFYLMEVWNLSYTSVMEIPCSRRYRLLMGKQQLQRRRADAAKKR